MNLKFYICLCFLGKISASKILTGEHKGPYDVLRTCLPKLVKEICPECVTLHHVIPAEKDWQADARAPGFYDFTPTTISTMDRIANRSNGQVDLYHVNDEAHLKIVAQYLRSANSESASILLVNTDFGRNFERNLGNTIRSVSKTGGARGVIFAVLIEDEVRVFKTLIKQTGTLTDESFRRLSVCDARSLPQAPTNVTKIINSEGSFVTVIVYPKMLPYIERFTDNPGGFIGHYIDVLKKKQNIIPKYNWSADIAPMSELEKLNEYYIMFDLAPGEKFISRLSAILFIKESIWVIVSPDLIGDKNILLKTFRHGVLLHLTLLAIYTSIMIYLSRDIDKTKIMLRLFGMFLGVGVGWLPNKSLFRFLVVLWCLTSYVLVQTYLATLTSDLSSPATYRNIRDTEDLIKSGIDLYCSYHVKQLYCNSKSKSSLDICEKCLSRSQEWLLNLTSRTIVLDKTHRSFAFNVESTVYRSCVVCKKFPVMPERIGVWPRMAYSNVGEKFLDTVNNVSHRLFESGLTEYWMSRYYVKNTDFRDSVHYVLNMSHLKDILIILYVGWSSSIVVFIIEILINWLRDD